MGNILHQGSRPRAAHRPGGGRGIAVAALVAAGGVGLASVATGAGAAVLTKISGTGVSAASASADADALTKAALANSAAVTNAALANAAAQAAAAPPVPAVPPVQAAPLPPIAAPAAACTDAEIVYAKGAPEKTGTLGNVVGDPYMAAIQRYITTQLTVGTYQVNYPALGDDISINQGALDLLNHLNAQMAACPAQRFVLVGYSEGASVIDTVMGVNPNMKDAGVVQTHVITPMQLAHVSSVAIFGNPMGAQGRVLAFEAPKTITARIFDFCETTDPVCQQAGKDMAAHTMYGADGKADEGAALSSRQLLTGGYGDQSPKNAFDS